MCGRFTLSTPAARLMESFQVTEFPPLKPRLNIAPTQSIVCIRQNATGEREATSMRWGLIPFWAKDLSIGNRLINARAETVAEKPSFRKAFASRRCLIPADGFYEWEKLPDRKKQPWLMQLADGKPFAFAGLWETWKPRPAAASSDLGEWLLSCTILTTSANADVMPVHDRMPVFVLPENYGTWLSNDASVGQLQTLTEPLKDGLLQRRPVSSVINNPRHEVTEI
ncbi:MAG: SOS response-associated peptidase [Fuerstiella sp.]